MTRRNYMRPEALTLKISRVTGQGSQHLFGHGHGQRGRRALGSTHRPLLLAAIAEARFRQAEAVIWPVSSR